MLVLVNKVKNNVVFHQSFSKVKTVSFFYFCDSIKFFPRAADNILVRSAQEALEIVNFIKEDK